LIRQVSLYYYAAYQNSHLPCAALVIELYGHTGARHCFLTINKDRELFVFSSNKFRLVEK